MDGIIGVNNVINQNDKVDYLSFYFSSQNFGFQNIQNLSN